MADSNINNKGGATSLLGDEDGAHRLATTPLENPPLNNIKPSFAMLEVVHQASELAENLINRNPMLPGIGALSGHAGTGKTHSAIQLINMFNAVHIEACSFWTRKSFFETLVTEMGVIPEKTIPKLANQLINYLKSSVNAPAIIIIDEAHILLNINRLLLDDIRKIHDLTGVSILLMGEEALPQDIQQFANFANRVMEYRQVPPLERHELELLIPIYAPDIGISPELQNKIYTHARGEVRRASTMLNAVLNYARSKNIKQVGVEVWAELPIGFELPTFRNRKDFGKA